MLNEINSHFVPHNRGTLKLATDLLKTDLTQSEVSAARGDDGSPSMLMEKPKASVCGLLPALWSRSRKRETEHGRLQPEQHCTIDSLSEAEREAYDILQSRIADSSVLDMYITRASRASSGRFCECFWSVRVADIDANKWVVVQGIRLDQVVSEVVTRWVLGQFDPDPFAGEDDDE